MKTYLLLFVILACMTLSACDISLLNARHIDKNISNLDFDIHEIEYSTHPSRFTVASYSHINRETKHKTDKLQDLRLVTNGRYKTWYWQVYADRQAFRFTKSFAYPRKATVLGEHGPESIIIPSWNEAMSDFAKTAIAVFGAKNLPLEIHITIVGQQVNFEKFIVHDDDRNMVLDYYFATSSWSFNSPENEFQWLVDTVATVGHEYSHGFIDAQNIKLPNAMTDEVMAYTFEQCVKLSAIGSQAGMAYLDQGGNKVDPRRLIFSKLIHTRGSASFNAYYLAEYNTVHLLGASAISKNDVEMKDKLLGLCMSQYQHINDFEKSFYPVRYVKPIQYNWN